MTAAQKAKARVRAAIVETSGLPLAEVARRHRRQGQYAPPELPLFQEQQEQGEQEPHPLDVLLARDSLEQGERAGA